MWPAIKKVGTSKTGSALVPKAESLPSEAAPHPRSEQSEDVKLQWEIWKGCKQLKLRSAGALPERRDRKTMCSYGLCTPTACCSLVSTTPNLPGSGKGAGTCLAWTAHAASLCIADLASCNCDTGRTDTGQGWPSQWRCGSRDWSLVYTITSQWERSTDLNSKDKYCPALLL